MYSFVVTRVNGEECPFTLSDKQIYRDPRIGWVLGLRYGYKHTVQEKFEGPDSIIPGARYNLHKQILPKKGDVITHIKSGRKLTVGDISGFICYQAPLLSDGVVVASITFEDYYKD